VATRDEWRKRILDQLGGEGVDVELTETQLDAAIQRALELWAKHRPFTRWYPFDLPASSTVISFFSEAATFIDNDHAAAGPVDSFDERWGFAGGRVFFQMQVWERTQERLTGTRPDWQWNPDERKLYISTQSRRQRCMVLCARERRLDEIEYYHESDFLKAAVAAAKMVLARVLGSMGDIPGPAGPIQTDHAKLGEDGKNEWNELVTKFEASVASYPPPRWVG
jgi:hypothetical protein